MYIRSFVFQYLLLNWNVKTYLEIGFEVCLPYLRFYESKSAVGSLWLFMYNSKLALSLLLL